MVDGGVARVLGKVESRNPANSVKCRLGLSLILDAERRGLLGPGKEIVRADERQYRHRAGVHGRNPRLPDHARHARDDELRAAQAVARVRREIGAHRRRLGHGGRGHGRGDHRQLGARPLRSVAAVQEPGKSQAHEHTTGPEIWRDTNGQIDILVCGVGTGGTITGIARFIKQTCGKGRFRPSRSSRAGSPILTQHRAGLPLRPGPHKIPGIGAGFVPDVLDMSLLDSIELATNDESIEYARRLTREEGILSGVSCGAAVAVAVRLAKLPENQDKTIVCILPDSGERYLTTALFDGGQELASESNGIIINRDVSVRSLVTDGWD